jgi:hypothetical protein
VGKYVDFSVIFLLSMGPNVSAGDDWKDARSHAWPDVGTERLIRYVKEGIDAEEGAEQGSEIDER